MNEKNRETEVKFFVCQLPELEQRLRQLGATCVEPRQLEVNYRFDTSNGELKHTQRMLRLRQYGETVLTFKGPSRTQDGVISRQEIEVKVEDFEQMRLVLEALGYGVVFVYEKYRTVYTFGGQTIMLDELPYGNFIEIEGDAAGIRTLSNRLGLEWKHALPTSYTLLFDNARAALDLPFRNLTFANFAGKNIHLDQIGVQPAD